MYFALPMSYSGLLCTGLLTQTYCADIFCVTFNQFSYIIAASALPAVIRALLLARQSS